MTDIDPSSESDTLAPTSKDAQPMVWLLLGEKRGDNAQVRNLANAVGLPFVEKTMVMKPEWVDGKPPVAASIEHLDVERSDSLDGPWPDLVMTAGRRLASVALHLKQVSGGRTRLVVVGKPRGRTQDFDLIVVARHYVLADAPNVARHDLPLMNVDLEALAETKKAWVGRLTLLPRPLSALFVGGPTGGLRLDVETTRRLLEKTRQTVDQRRGSLYIVTSRRTPGPVNDFLREAKTPNEQLYVYDAETPAHDNPYQGLLALADHFVVTTDSLSMMVEVARLGRPLSLFPLERATTGLEGFLTRVGLLRRLSPRNDAIPAGGLEARLASGLGRPVHSRDLTAISRLLVAERLASWLGDPVIQPEAYRDDALERVAARIRGLLGA